MENSRSARHPAGSARHLYVVGSDRRAPFPPPVTDTEPIPDEPFDWSGVDDRDRPCLTEVLALIDRYCADRLDPEYRTIMRRILARVATRDPGPLRARADATRTAAGLVWLAMEGNSSLGRRRWRARGVWAWFGIGNAVDRGRKLGVAAGLVPEPVRTGPGASSLTFRDASLLHSSFRLRQIELQKVIAEILETTLAENAARDAALTHGAARRGRAPGQLAPVISPQFGGPRPA